MIVAEFSLLGLLVEVGCFLSTIGFLRFCSLCGIHVKVEIISVGDSNS